MTLSAEERRALQALTAAGKASARKLTHARILLKADRGPEGPGWNDEEMTEGLEVGHATVERVRQQFVEEGLVAALNRRKPRREYRRKLDGEAFPADEAKRIADRLEIHYTPKHGSRLDMAEIELGILGRQCLDRRIDNAEALTREVAAWEAQRNAAQAKAIRRFTTDDARIKLKKLSPSMED